MTTPYTPTQQNIDAAWPSSSQRFGYRPIRETVNITLELHLYWKSFVRMSAIPERFREEVCQLSLGSTYPGVDEKHDAFYTHDVYRWLRAIGVAAEFVEP